jgi:hypothetical protein
MNFWNVTVILTGIAAAAVAAFHLGQWSANVPRMDEALCRIPEGCQATIYCGDEALHVYPGLYWFQKREEPHDDRRFRPGQARGQVAAD